MEKKYKIFIALFFILVFFSLFSYKNAANPENNKGQLRKVKISDAVIRVEIADTPEKREKGLSDRDSLPEDQGMLFVFPESDYHLFWMKNMRFGLDFIWLQGSKVVEITLRIKPEDYQPPNVMKPKEKVDKVLEVNAGTAEKLNIKVGDSVEF